MKNISEICTKSITILNNNNNKKNTLKFSCKVFFCIANFNKILNISVTLIFSFFVSSKSVFWRLTSFLSERFYKNPFYPEVKIVFLHSLFVRVYGFGGIIQTIQSREILLFKSLPIEYIPVLVTANLVNMFSKRNKLQR